MLKMKCAKCHELITSALLSDLEELTCSHCHAQVPVKDIMVTAEGFTFHRNDLNKRMHTYKNLLIDLLKERELLEQDPTASEEGKGSLERMVQALRDLMATGRNNYRVQFNNDGLKLQFRIDGQQHNGLMRDLSMSGACLKVGSTNLVPRRSYPLTLEFSLPGSEHRFIIEGTVCWTGDKMFGVSFTAIEAGDSSVLWEYIATEAEGRVPNAKVRPCLCPKN